MEDKKKLNITFESTLDNIVELNPSFDKGILKIAYTGLNRNNSFISKETFEKDISTMFLCPVVANYSIDSNQIGSHDIALKPDTDGHLEMINVTQPVGVIPESAQWYWENINDNGMIHEYLCTEAILWKRQPCYQKIKENGITSESMEIDVNEAHMVDGYYQIDDFCFTAFCLLGSAEPCFESASLQVFSKQDFKEQYTQMMKEFKESFSIKSQSSLEVDDINKTFSQENEKEERILNEEKTKLLKKYNLTIDKLDFKIDDLSVEDTETKLKEFAEAHKENSKVNFSATYNQKRDALRNAVDAIVVKDADGNVIESTYFYVMDFDDNYVYVEKDYWNENGDFEETNGRFTYTFDDSTITATIISEWEEMFLVWLTADEKATHDAQNSTFSALQTEFNTYKETYKTAETDVETLRTYQTEKLATERKNAEDKVFAMTEFEKIHDNDEFKAIQEKAKDYSIGDLTDKCFAILGRANANFSLNDSKPKATVKVTVDVTNDKTDPYGGLFETYGNK